MKTLTKGLILSAILGAALLADAAPASKAKMMSEDYAAKRFGINIGLGNPYPGLIGINGAYNLDKNIRLTAGYSEIEVTSSVSFSGGSWQSESVKAETYAAGAQYLFTDWRFRPVAGASVGYFKVSGNGEIDLDGFTESTGIITSNLGFDYIGESGFNASTGMNLALAGGNGAGFYLNAGYFF